MGAPARRRQQRKLETAMRARRQEIKLLQEGNASEDNIINARCRYRGTSQEYTALSRAMGLPQQRQRVTVDGLGNIGVGKYKKAVANSSKSGIIRDKKITEAVENGSITLTLNAEKQNPHIYGSTSYDPSQNKSYFTVSYEELQKILKENYGTGEVITYVNGQIRERIKIDKEIGFVIGKNGDKLGKTSRFTVHYSKKRTHIVPMMEDE